MSFTRLCRPALRHASQSRPFHASASTSMPRAGPVDASNRRARLDDIISEEDLMEGVNQGDDTSAGGHIALRQMRQTLYYLRLIEHEMPRLVAYRKPFVPPTAANPLAVRSISYGGEEHPASRKRTVVVPVAHLPLQDKDAIHTFKLLAGPRWSPEPPRDAGVGPEEIGREHGYFKISCEDYPKGPMNLKWISDTLDRLIMEANNQKKKFADIPLDTRHLDAKARKAKKGGHAYGRGTTRPTLKDFPKEWLPASIPETQPTATP
ncbi:hypothetical protein QCA50_002128 [Cerrena zonata]|uniref:Small ribosomal subunit protein mS35 mitochondrial conserved domain-containing protein n=1 Tax=Cerrena zonata TaxID=2478898 RepID=A0AAW0GUP8_9APHY